MNKYYTIRIKYIIYLVLFCITFITGQFCYGQDQDSSGVNVQVISDEADAVLRILNKKKAGETISDTDWQTLFSSQGYNRLKKRETAVHGGFTDNDFKKFILSGNLDDHITALEAALKKWTEIEVNEAARRSLAYLPEGSKIHAKIFPLIKPKKNSFVYDFDNDPAIYLYVDTLKTKEQLENILAHELHHIGFAENCKATPSSSDSSVNTVLDWIGAFGEGFAMLAAAGGPDVNPHKYSDPEDRQRWDKDIANFNADLKKVNGFFTEILRNKLSRVKIDSTGYTFFGIQGPWYTVGWQMSVVIEKTYGRKKLIQCICNQKLLLPTYNNAVVVYNEKTGSGLAFWSHDVIGSLTR